MLRVEVSPPAGTRPPPGARRLKVFAGSRSQIRRPQHPEVSFSLAPDTAAVVSAGSDFGKYPRVRDTWDRSATSAEDSGTTATDFGTGASVYIPI